MSIVEVENCFEMLERRGTAGRNLCACLVVGWDARSESVCGNVFCTVMQYLLGGILLLIVRNDCGKTMKERPDIVRTKRKGRSAGETALLIF